MLVSVGAGVSVGVSVAVTVPTGVAVTVPAAMPETAAGLASARTHKASDSVNVREQTVSTLIIRAPWICVAAE